MQNLKILEKIIGVYFNDKTLLTLSLTHKSYHSIDNNEKLEFLGDRVLGLILSKKILEMYPNEIVGNLDKKFASLVNRKTCLSISKKIDLGKFLILGKTYKKKSIIEDKILADACEALIGAIYLDAGFEIAKNFIYKFWYIELGKTINTKKDYKTRLQEHSLKIYKKLPIYKVLSFKGPKHKPSYKISVKIEDSKYFYGIGKSKKDAELLAAKKLINNLKLK